MVIRMPHKYEFINWLFRLWLRIKIAATVISTEYVVVIYFTDNDLESLVKDGVMHPDSVVHMSFAGCMEHQGLTVIKEVAKWIDDVDIICNKAEFEAFVQEHIKKEGKNPLRNK